MMSLAPR